MSTHVLGYPLNNRLKMCTLYLNEFMTHTLITMKNIMWKMYCNQLEPQMNEPTT
jgi:hypothetical protein